MPHPSPRRVANLYTAALFEAPPAMMAAMLPWVQSVYAGHVLALADKRIERATGRIKAIEENLAAAQKWLSRAPTAVKKLKPGQSTRVLIGDPTGSKKNMSAVGIKSDLYMWETIGEPRYEIGRSPWKSTRIKYDGTGLEATPYEDAIERLQKAVTEILDEWRYRLNTMRRQKTQEDGPGLVENHLLRREALRYFKGSKPKEYSATATRQFPIDLTGWKYLQEGFSPDLGGIDTYNDLIDEANQALQEEIDEAKKNYAQAAKLFKKIEARELDPDPIVDSYGRVHWDHEYFKSADALGYWDTGKLIRALEEGRKPEAMAVIRYLPSLINRQTKEYAVPVTEAQGMFVERLTPGEVSATLRAKGFDELTCVIFFKAHTRRGGQWMPSKMQLEVDIWHPDPQNVAQFDKGLFENERILRHELQHVGQDALRILAALPENAGLPPKDLREPDATIGGRPRGPGGGVRYDRPKIKHPRRDIEFQTDLSDAVDRFVRAVAKRPKREWRQYVRQFTAIEPTRGWTNDFFQTWKETNPGKWQKAVKEFIAEIQRRGIDLPPESSSMRSARRHLLEQWYG